VGYFFRGMKPLGKSAEPAPQGEGMPQHRLQSRIDGRLTHWHGPLARVVCRAVLAAGIVCAATAAARAGDDDTQSSGGSFYDKFLQVIGVSGGPDINYGERSPLVVPPTKDLPPPSAAAAPAVPDWPKDPDVNRRAKAKVKEKPHPHPDYASDDARPLRPSELNVPGANTAGRGSAPTPGASSNADYPERDYTPPKKSVFDLFNTSKQQYATFTGEPARTSLTDPPAGYMTPSADQPYGIGPDQKRYKIPTVADRAELSSGTAGSNEATPGH
jgi:hypothetical protein